MSLARSSPRSPVGSSVHAKGSSLGLADRTLGKQESREASVWRRRSVLRQVARPLLRTRGKVGGVQRAKRQGLGKVDGRAEKRLCVHRVAFTFRAILIFGYAWNSEKLQDIYPQVKQITEDDDSAFYAAFRLHLAKDQNTGCRQRNRKVGWILCIAHARAHACKLLPIKNYTNSDVITKREYAEHLKKEPTGDRNNV